MKDKIFAFFKSIYKKLPINYKTKNKLKGTFYRLFGFMFKNTTSYRVWKSINHRESRSDAVIPDRNIACKYKCKGTIAVQLHLYYVDLLHEFIQYFNNIPYEFDILVSVVDKEKAGYVRNEFEKVKNVKNVYVETVINRGRDVAPFICVFGKKICEYDYIFHVHSKKSLFTGGEQTDWRRYLMDGLMGSEDIVRQNFYLMETGEKAGIIYPETFPNMPYQGHTWLQNKQARDELLSRIGVMGRTEDIYIDYPMGTMFLARVDAIRQFFQADMRADEFPKEAGQTDGTIAHAFERCLSLVCRYNGYNLLIYDAEKGIYSYNYGIKNLNQYTVKSYEGMKKEMWEYDIVSFDIFDTLISRKISSPDGILSLTELRADQALGEKTDFKEKRKHAELIYRSKYPQKDPDTEDIYRELMRLTGWDSEKISKIKGIETATEYSLAEPKTEMIQVLKYIKHELKKQVYLISDMHLSGDDIEKILLKCGIDNSDYDEMLLSSCMNLRKDNGTMWQYFSSVHNEAKCIHVGDNEVSDVQIPGDYKIQNYHVMHPKALFQLSDLGRAIGSINDSAPSDAVELGLILHSLYSDPFKYNTLGLKVRMTGGREFGYNITGPVVLNYVLWLIEEARKAGSHHIWFFSREGFIFKRVFDIICPYIMEDTEEIKGKYVYVSRRALSLAAVERGEDMSGPLDIYYEGRLGNLLKKRFGIEDDSIADEDIKLPDNKGKVLKVLEQYKDEILERAAKERESYVSYMDKLLQNISQEDRIIVSDIGYSGTIQYYLSKILHRTFDGRYMATDSQKKPLAIKGNTVQGYYIDNDSEQELSKSYIHRYHLLMESIFISPEGQLVGIDHNGAPVFDEDNNPLYNHVISDIHRGIEEYALDWGSIMKDTLMAGLPGKELPEALVNAVIKTDIADKKIADSLVVDDRYCSGEVKNAVEYYKKRN